MNLNLLFAIIQIVGIALLLFELVFILLQKPSRLQMILIIIVVSCLVSFVGYLLEITAKTVEGALYGTYVGYISKPFSLVAMLLFLFEFSNIKHKRWPFLLLTTYFIFLSTMVFTNEYHHLYYTSVEFDPTRNGSGLILGHGVFWYMYMVSTILIFVFYTILIIFEFRRSKTKQAKQMVVFMFLILFFGILGLICFITGWTGGYDATLAGTFLGVLCVFILLMKYRLFDTLTLAKEKLLAGATSGYIVIDAREKISYFNDICAQLFPELADVGKFKFDDNSVLNKLGRIDQNKPFFFEDKVFKLSINEIDNTNRLGHTRLIGRSYIFTNITEEYYYQKTLHSDIKKATKKIRNIQKNTLIAFANLVEARDGCTGAHIKNVSKYAKAIAVELSKHPKYKNVVNDEFIEMIEECSPLHDVGKIKIPDAILGKKGKLDPQEREIMETHAIEGGKIIEDVFRNIEEDNYVDLSNELVTCHHEWWDGTGYPYKLKGKDIPLSARIMAIADVYDALRMVRPYKQAFSKEKAIQIMKEERGTHFDPELLDIFLKIIDSVDLKN